LVDENRVNEQELNILYQIIRNINSGRALSTKYIINSQPGTALRLAHLPRATVSSTAAAGCPACCQHRPGDFTRREQGEPFFVAAPQKYTRSGSTGFTLPITFCGGGIAFEGVGRKSRAVFVAPTDPSDRLDPTTAGFAVAIVWDLALC
jgi:hypothetical protein